MNLRPRDTKKDSFEEEIRKGTSVHDVRHWIELIIKLSVVVVILWWAKPLYILHFSFNSANDICTSWEEYNGNIINGADVTSVSPANISGRAAEVIKDYPYEINIENFYIHRTIAKCKEWRDMTKCELNASDEGCICDEWQTKQVLDATAVGETCIPLTPSDFNQKLTITTTPGHMPQEMVISNPINDSAFSGQLCFEFSEEIESITVGNRTITHSAPVIKNESVCIKAREQNECEKGMKDWVWANTTMVAEGHIIGCIDSALDVTTGSCIPDKFCRKKMLGDYSCAELFEFIAALDSSDYTPISAETNITDCGFFCIGYTQKEIVKIFKDRGCV